MRAAVEAAKEVSVGVISKVYPTRSHSGGAQGGINAVLNPPDTPESHTYDTVKGSDWLGDQDTIRIFVEEAPRDIAELERMGVNFSRTPDGNIAQRELGGASYPRCCFAADLTGHKLLHAMYEQLIKSKVVVYPEWFVSSLLVRNGSCVGVVAYDLKTGAFVTFRARAVVSATGGYGRTYARTTNSMIVTGDGMSLALRAGAELADMEFVQFHPTTLHGTNILVSEAVRGEGGYLKNARGERFMEKYAPEKMELAPRDIVSRCIETEAREGRAFEEGYVHLDVTHFGAQKITERIPQVRGLAERFAGVNLVNRPMPVEPGQHYSMGGIRTDNDGKSSLPGLYAAGECACASVHGANRLGGNSLMETIVFGRRAGAEAADFARGTGEANVKDADAEDERLGLKKVVNKKGSEKLSGIKAELQGTMTNLAGVFRNEKGLKKALEKIRQLKERRKKARFKDTCPVYNIELVEYLELGSLLNVAEVILMGALARSESRGAHFREDYPERSDEQWLKHTVAGYDGKGKVRLHYEPVRIGELPPERRGY